MVARFEDRQVTGPDSLAVLALALLWIVVVLATGLGGDYPLNDDWTYYWSARHLAETGEMRILELVAPSAVAHVAWGAAVIHLFGPSYLPLRIGTLCWSLCAQILCYALARSAGLDVRRAFFCAAALALSPWCVNLSLSYMTDVPWMALMLGAVLATVHARGRRRLLLPVAGVLLGAATLSRQFAVLTLPALALVAALDARTGAGRLDLGLALRRVMALSLPALLIFGGFQFWYTRIHGPTLANVDTFSRIRDAYPYYPPAHAMAIWHYLGWWTFSVAVALLVTGRLGDLVTRRTAIVSTLALVTFSMLVLVERHLVVEPLTMSQRFPLTMPYLNNIVYLAGVGPATLLDVAGGVSPRPHYALWPGVSLTIASTFGGVVAAACIVAAARRALAFARGRDRDTTAGRVMLVCLGTGASYLLWHVVTGPFVLDRYVWFAMPLLLPLVAVALPDPLRGRAAAAVVLCVAATGLFSVVATREYLAWNTARDEAVRDLETRGVPITRIEAGYEVNGSRHFLDYFQRTGRLQPHTPSVWWVENPRYKLAFRAGTDPACSDVARYPFWSLFGDTALFVLDCESAAK